MININNLVGDHYTNEGFEKYFRSTHSFIHSFTLVLEYSIPRIDQNSLLSKVYILIGKVDSQLIITE